VLLRREYGYRESLAIAAVLFTAGAALAIAGGTASDSVPAESESKPRSGAVKGGGDSVGEESAPAVGGDVGSRLSVWEEAVGDDPAEWLVGRGVGEVGTAADRARNPGIPSRAEGREPREWVDSGYVAAIADVGVLGLGLLLALIARLVVLAIDGARRGTSAGWVALGLLVVLIVDALTRESFTGFPTAFLCLFLVGISLAAARESLSPARSSAASAG
jgi:hypothetical protein